MHLLINYIERREMTVPELAALSGIHERTIMNILKDPDCDPKKSTILRLSMALNVHPQRLFFPDIQVMDEKEWEKRRKILNMPQRDRSDVAGFWRAP